jgi:hypothetical protein
MIAILLFSVVLYVAIAFALLKVAQWLAGWRAVAAVGLGVVALLAYGSYSIHASCAVEPVFIPPKCDNTKACGDGKMIFACDSADGAIAYLTANLVHPITALLTAILTYLVARKSRSITGAT